MDCFRLVFHVQLLEEKIVYLVVGYRKIVVVRDYDYIIGGADVVSYRDPIEDNSPFPRATYVIAVGFF